MGSVKGMKRGQRISPVRRNMWRSMRIMRRFAVADLQRTASAEYWSAVKWLTMLQKHGYVECTRPGAPGRPAEYRLVKDAGPEYPLRCDACGRQLQEKGCRGKKTFAGAQPAPDAKTSAPTARAAMWETMQAGRRFSIADLCRIPGVTLHSAYKWTSQLMNHGYVERVDASGNTAEYLLVSRRGREYPVACRKCGRSLHKQGCRGEKSHQNKENGTC